ncbi:hypothetical protein PTT_03333 [Pyrenophora teres f. teres 0-1]|uniref:Uncharacterized protein n=1 Tax=Pyrenophora teres f. teres (strain 0-1) TaxID=861557 RepID=E3RDX7_PYRTT|nr:hypothetical protein PTT_03333 [Pyrenophora teres f. teres 0-1]
MGHIQDFKDIDLEMYDLFGAGHRTSIYEFASSDGHYQLRYKLCNEGEKDYTTLDLALNKLFDRSSRDFYLIGESGVTKEYYRTTNF